jgi:AcrR family transcriptional regulator
MRSIPNIYFFAFLLETSKQLTVYVFLIFKKSKSVCFFIFYFFDFFRCFLIHKWDNMPVSYHKLNHIDEKILKATIALGGTRTGKQGFSTREIAGRCSVSEYVIFKHYQTKENLLFNAEKEIGRILSDKAIEIAQSSSTLETFFTPYLEYLLSHRQTTYFALNFTSAVPQVCPIALTQENKNENPFALDASNILPFFIKNPANPELIWRFLLRNILHFASVLLDKSVEDIPATREQMLQLLEKGISIFIKGASYERS